METGMGIPLGKFSPQKSDKVFVTEKLPLGKHFGAQLARYDAELWVEITWISDTGEHHGIKVPLGDYMRAGQKMAGGYTVQMNDQLVTDLNNSDIRDGSYEFEFNRGAASMLLYLRENGLL